MKFSIKNINLDLNNVFSVCVSPGVLVLDRALRMPSGVMSTRDRMLARAGLEGVTFEAADWPEGVVGVPGDGRAGLTAEGHLQHRCKGFKKGDLENHRHFLWTKII